MDATDFLSRVSLFSLLKKEDLQRIARLTQDHTFQDGDPVISEGDHDTRLFIIVEGRAKVIGHEILSAQLLVVTEDRRRILVDVAEVSPESADRKKERAEPNHAANP